MLIVQSCRCNLSTVLIKILQLLLAVKKKIIFKHLHKDLQKIGFRMGYCRFKTTVKMIKKFLTELNIFPYLHTTLIQGGP